MKKIFILSLAFVWLLQACHSTSEEKQVTKKTSAETEVVMPKMSLKVSSMKANIGDSLIIWLKLKNKVQPDSIFFFVNNDKVYICKTSDTFFVWHTDTAHAGTQYIQANAYYKGAYSLSSSTCILYSDIKPKMFSYRVIEELPHDRSAYTQGFYFENNFFYEATGLKGESTLRKVIPKTGEVISSFAIPASIFGEGITAFHNKIIQLSWQSRLGYVYEKDNFKLLEQFNYSTEGWGITTDSTFLIMSDGTNYLYFLNPQDFSIVKSLEVYDNHSPVTKLNELEYIEGKIWANIYMTNKIAIIEPETGKIDAYVDLTGLLNPKLRQADTDVLNGIAYDKKTKRIWLTGKKWPKVYRIVLKNKD